MVSDMECVETAEYTVDRKLLVSLSLRRVARRWWWVAVIPLLGAIEMLVTTGDIVWLLAALMICMVLWPWMVMMAYYSVALRPEIIKAMTPVRARVSADGVTFVTDGDVTERAMRWDEADSVWVRSTCVALWRHGDIMVIPRTAVASDAGWDMVTEWGMSSKTGS